MINILHKLSIAAHNRTTYRVGLLQAKAYRLLKQRTALILKKSKLSTIEWAFLGLIADKKSLRAREAALELGVKPPFITEITTTLIKRGLITVTQDADDGRVRPISLTPSGAAFVEKTEAHVRSEIRPLLSGIALKDLLGYLTVLEKLIDNGSQK